MLILNEQFSSIEVNILKQLLFKDAVKMFVELLGILVCFFFQTTALETRSLKLISFNKTAKENLSYII